MSNPGTPFLPQMLSPSAYEIGRYGRTPVSYFHGLPNISIPLTEVRARGFTIPVTLSYHAGGNKPDQHPGWVGLGWKLNAGGCIVRVVNGKKDEMSSMEYGALTGRYDTPGYLHHIAEVQTDTNWDDDQTFWNKTFFEHIEYEPDEYIIDAPGIHASFYITGPNKIAVVSRDESAIELESYDFGNDSGTPELDMYPDKCTRPIKACRYQYLKRFIIKDHLGSVRAVVSETGAVQQTNDYYPIGDLFGSTGTTDSSDNRYRFTGKELGNETGLYDFSARYLHTSLGRFTTLDPLAEKYPSISPYAYCNGNPVNFVDIDGMDIYRYDDKSGTFHLYQTNDDDFDQVGRFKYNKETGEYDLKTRKDGSAKTRMDKIEKGILSDGLNLLSDSHAWSTDDVSVEGFQEFIVKYSDMAGREMAGYYYTEIGGNEYKYLHTGRGMNNTYDSSTSMPNIFRPRPDLYGKVVEHTNWHTHPSNSDSRYKASSKDKEFKLKHQRKGVRRFIILTGNPDVEIIEY